MNEDERHRGLPETHLHAGVGRREKSFTVQHEGPGKAEDGSSRGNGDELADGGRR